MAIVKKSAENHQDAPVKSVGIFTHDLYPFKPWGQGRYVFDLVRHLVPKCEGKLTVFSPSDNIEWPFHVRLFPGSHDSLGKNISFSLRLARVMEELIDRYRLDLVHFQGGPGGLFLFKRPSVPVVYTVHHTYFQQQKYIRSQRWKYLLYLIEQTSYQKSRHIMADSESTRNILLKLYGIPSHTCTTVPIGVDTTRFYPLDKDRIPNSLFFIGRLEKRKGIDFLIKALERVRRTIPDVKVYLVGGGNLDRSTIQYIKRHNLMSHLSFEGTIPDKMVNAWYNRVTAVVIPSVFEGFGLTAIESMASGTPVIATRVDGLKDIVIHGKNGLLAAYNDDRALSAHIINVLTNEGMRQKLVQHGFHTVNRSYNWGKIGDNVLNTYRSVGADKC
jgi:glycosyltransferase involved in cell wall biosynthesis